MCICVYLWASLGMYRNPERYGLIRRLRVRYKGGGMGGMGMGGMGSIKDTCKKIH
jgi:hypothetical protein